MIKNKITLFILSLFVFFALVSCVSTKQTKEALLTEENSRMFWKISGYDAEGNPSTVYVQGTIHLGDDRLYPLSDEVLEAWAISDRVAGELSQQDMVDIQTRTVQEINASYVKAEGKNVLTSLDQNEIQILYGILGQENIDTLALFEPWVLNITSSAYVLINGGLDPTKGLDSLFLTKAQQDAKEFVSLDTIDTQFNVILFGDYQEQLIMLKASLDELKDTTDDNDAVKELYDAYITDDRVKMTEIVDAESESEYELQNKDLFDRYKAITYNDRNKDWADKIKGFLAEGGTTFIFAGCAHFIGEDSVFDYLEDNGTL